VESFVFHFTIICKSSNLLNKKTINIYIKNNRFGSSIGNLSVLTRVGKNTPKLNWIKSGNIGDYWNFGVFNAREVSEFVVIFEGKHGGSITGDIVSTRFAFLEAVFNF
jgi:hypothetical protein